MHAVRKLSVWYKIPIWFQNNVCPNTLFQKYKLNQLTTGIHSCIGHVLRKYIYREFLKDTTTETSHGKVNSYFFQSLSWLYQLAYFVKCKRTLLELNFYQPYPSSWREWILSLGIFTGSRAVSLQLTAKKCTKKRDGRRWNWLTHVHKDWKNANSPFKWRSRCRRVVGT